MKHKDRITLMEFIGFKLEEIRQSTGIALEEIEKLETEFEELEYVDATLDLAYKKVINYLNKTRGRNV